MKYLNKVTFLLENSNYGKKVKTILLDRIVKNKLKIDVDFYALKHLYTTKVISLYDKKLASGINGHKSGMMNERHYDTLHNQRILEEAKNINI